MVPCFSYKDLLCKWLWMKPYLRIILEASKLIGSYNREHQQSMSCMFEVSIVFNRPSNVLTILQRRTIYKWEIPLQNTFNETKRIKYEIRHWIGVEFQLLTESMPQNLKQLIIIVVVISVFMKQPKLVVSIFNILCYGFWGVVKSTIPSSNTIPMT